MSRTLVFSQVQIKRRQEDGPSLDQKASCLLPELWRPVHLIRFSFIDLVAHCTQPENFIAYKLKTVWLWFTFYHGDLLKTQAEDAVWFTNVSKQLFIVKTTLSSKSQWCWKGATIVGPSGACWLCAAMLIACKYFALNFFSTVWLHISVPCYVCEVRGKRHRAHLL